MIICILSPKCFKVRFYSPPLINTVLDISNSGSYMNNISGIDKFAFDSFLITEKVVIKNIE